MTYIWIGTMGIVGVLCRYGLDQFIGTWKAPFPVSTLIINIVGSFLIGVVYVLGTDRGIISENVRVALGVGLLGGFTTFSAFSLQAVLLIESKQWAFALTYMILSPILGLVSAYAGVTLTRIYAG